MNPDYKKYKALNLDGVPSGLREKNGFAFEAAAFTFPTEG